MNSAYYEMMDKMEKCGVDVEYINGWACGYMRNPTRGQQHLNDAYEAGYSDGREGVMEGYADWVRQAG